jgi:hypothetical protein
MKWQLLLVLLSSCPPVILSSRLPNVPLLVGNFVYRSILFCS